MNDIKEKVESLLTELITLDDNDWRLVRRLEYIHAKFSNELEHYAVNVNAVSGRNKDNMRRAIALVALSKERPDIYASIVQLIQDEHDKHKPGAHGTVTLQDNDHMRKSRAEYMRRYRAKKRLMQT